MDFIAAARLLDEALREDPKHAISPVRLAHVYLAADRPVEALAVCKRAAAADGLHPRRGLCFATGMALMRLSREAQAERAFLQEIFNHAESFEALEAIFVLPRNANDPLRIEALSARLPAEYLAYPATRAYRALAKGLAGDADAVSSAFDNTMIWRKAMIAPPAFVEIAAFNQALAQEIIANPNLHRVRGEAFLRTKTLGYSTEPALRSLLGLIQRGSEDYVRSLADRQALSALPALPRRVTLDVQANLLYGAQAQRPHIHKYALISGVYHIKVPPSPEGDPDAGALTFGATHPDGRLVAGFERLSLQPVEGVMTFFPPHMFHAVNATRSNEPRIALAFDVVRC